MILAWASPFNHYPRAPALEVRLNDLPHYEYT